MFSSLGDIVCTLIIEIIDIFKEQLSTYLKKKMGGEGGTYL